LVWLLAKVINFVSADKSFRAQQKSRQFADESEIHQEAQRTLKERWTSISEELNTWFHGLPDSFRPCARIPQHSLRSGDVARGYSFPEIWFASAMTGGCIQSFHMARILLLLHNPHAPTAHSSSVSGFLQFCRSTEAGIKRGCQEMCGIALSAKSASIYVHQTQPLFVAGLCLRDPNERQLVVDLLRRVQSDLGWETEYRIRQLYQEWECKSPSAGHTPES
jgi:hypothetical protein